MHIGRIGNAIEIIGGDGKIVGDLGCAGIARGTIECGTGIFTTEGPAQRVLPPSASNDQQSHGF
jgi:hypothetical protein